MRLIQRMDPEKVHMKIIYNLQTWSALIKSSSGWRDFRIHSLVYCDFCIYLFFPLAALKLGPESLKMTGLLLILQSGNEWRAARDFCISLNDMKMSHIPFIFYYTYFSPLSVSPSTGQLSQGSSFCFFNLENKIMQYHYSQKRNNNRHLCHLRFFLNSNKFFLTSQYPIFFKI